MQTGVHWGLEGRPKAGNTGTTPSLYLRISTWEIARSKFDVIKISNVKIFVDFIFVRRGIIRNIRKFAPIQNFLLYGMSGILPEEDRHVFSVIMLRVTRQSFSTEKCTERTSLQLYLSINLQGKHTIGKLFRDYIFNPYVHEAL